MRTAVTLIALLLLAAPASAQSHDPRRLFPHEAEVSAPSGLARLPLDAAVLAGAQPDLSDVRLYREDENEVPYLVAAERPNVDERRYALTLVALTQTEVPREDLPPHYRESLTVVAPPTEGRRWLELGSWREHFVREVVVRDAETDEELARASVFRLAAPRRERLRVALPDIGTARRTLSLELVGDAGYLEPTIDLVVTNEREAPPVLEVALEELSRTDEDGVTRIVFARPRGLVPNRLLFEAADAAFFREIRVADEQQGVGPRAIGQAPVWRVPELEGAEDLEVQLSPARGERLVVEIEDGDSPPLTSLQVRAQIRRPAIVFTSFGGPHTLRFGGARALRPRYDLAPIASELSQVAERYGREAELGPVRDNPRFEAGPALAFAMEPGRDVDAAGFSHAATLTVTGADEGLSRTSLPAELVAALRDDRGDLRVVDGDRRQRAYLWGAEERREIDVSVSAPTIEDESSRFAIALPAEPTWVSGLELEVDADYVVRDYEVRGIDGAGRWQTLTAGSLLRSPGTGEALVIEWPRARVSTLELVVRDGDDAPLAIEGATLTEVTWPLFVAAPDGEYTLLAGRPEESAPVYQIAQARELVLAVRAADAHVSGVAANPAHVPASWWEAADVSTWVVWAVLLLAMLVLGLLTARVVRNQDPEPDPEAGEGDGEPPDDEPEPDPDPPSSTPLAF